MIALMRKDFYASGIRPKYVLSFFVLIFVLFLLFPLDAYLPIIAYSTFLFAPLSFFLSVYNYTEADDYKGEMILPIRRRDIVLARYFSYLLLTLLCISEVFLLLFVKQRLGHGDLLEYQKNLIFTGIGVTLLFGGLIFFFVFLFGHRNIKTFAMLSFILTLVPVRLYMELVKAVLHLQDVFDIYRHPSVIGYFVAFSSAFFALSCWISVFNIKRREF